ncbi:hypothetical protein [Vibrio sp. 1180_3]|uniref:hypothetical protein n=1 Tax=Vibrio sp. 1180_3 TaxID=2528832 RepID=UPI002405246E|nr:hypothetical protein [Vibrio sp. 1180_3]MDF9399079.1 hypothetical protein [Vibrio sp. 1180_3]
MSIISIITQANALALENGTAKLVIEPQENGTLVVKVNDQTVFETGREATYSSCCEAVLRYMNSY